MKSCPTCQSSYPDNYQVCPKDRTPLTSWGAWTDGTVVRGKYRILGSLGHGGMADVYKALHVTFGEVRALKVMSAEFLHDELFVKRFKQEAVACRRLRHPNAVQVDDIDEAEDGRPFIVMEYVEGRNLRDAIHDEAPMQVARVCRIARQVAAALDAAHRLGMVHRDVKPANILVLSTPEGEQAKVLDFGIAKLREGRSTDATAGMTLTGPGMVVGTPPYMSPEQALGKRGDEIDGRSDLYSLGIVMYQMLAGELPFAADTTVAMLLAHIQSPPAPLQGRPGLTIPEPITAVVMKCLEKKPEERPASAKVLIEELERAEKETGVSEATTAPAASVTVATGAGDKRSAGQVGNELTAEQVTPIVVPAVPATVVPASAGAPVAALRTAPLPESQAAKEPRLEPPPPSPSGKANAAVAAIAVESGRKEGSAAVARKRSSGLGLAFLAALLLAGLIGGGWYAYQRYHGRRSPAVEATTSPVPSAPSSSSAATVGSEPNPAPATTPASAEGVASATPASPTPIPPVPSPGSNGGTGVRGVNADASGNKPAVALAKKPQVSTSSHKAPTPAQGKPIPALTAETESAPAAPLPSLSTTTTAAASVPSSEVGNPILRVRSTPSGADVYVDDVFLGKTSPEGVLELDDIAVGRHRLRVARAGYQDYIDRISLRLGSPVDMPVKLNPVGGSYHVSHDHFRGSTPGTLTVSDGRIRFKPDKGKESVDIAYADVKEVGEEASGFYFKAKGKKYSFKSGSPAVVVETIRQATGLGSGHS